MLRTLASRIRLLVVILCLGFGLSILVAFRILSGRQIDATARNDVSLTSGVLATYFNDRTNLLSSLTAIEAVGKRVKSLADTDRETIATEVPNVLKESQVDAITITGPDGLVYGEAGFPHSATDLRNAPGVAAAMQGRSWAGIESRNGEILIAATEPLISGDYVKATLTTYLRLGTVFARSIKSKAPLEIAFVKDGKVTATSLGSVDIEIHKAGETWTLNADGRDYSARYAQLPGSMTSDNAGFVVMRPVEDIVGPYRTFSFTFLSVLAIVAALALFAGSVFAAGVARSLDSVVRAAQELQSGRWPEKLEAKRTDEIGVLEGSFNEMSDALRISQERLVSMLDVDALTELDNHRRFKEKLEQEAARTTASDQTLALLFVDIDHFGEYNTLHGHAAGDRALQDLAAVLRAERPEFATVSRYGGEEFAALLPNGGIRDAEELFDKVRRGLKGFTVSGGCAELSSARGRSDGLVAAAELALQRAKQLGRDRVCEFASVPGAGDDEPMMLYRHLQDGTYSTVRALAAAVDAKDTYTHGHSDRVARFAADLAAFVGSDSTEVEQVLRCGTLHDVGKIGVPDAILQKPSKLNPEETRIMQSHSVLGEFIVGKVPQLSELLPGVRHHHERYDGGGYPDGLRGEQIPRIARFLAVADTFDAMTSDRPYRKGLEPDEALDEIERNAGIQFDPEFALAFVKMVRQKASASAR